MHPQTSAMEVKHRPLRIVLGWGPKYDRLNSTRVSKAILLLLLLPHVDFIEFL